MGLAQTGTGKTAAFGLPLAQLLLADGRRPGARAVAALILAPTRELAGQIADSLRGFARETPLRIRTVVGGASIGRQTQDLQRGADVLIATPGRLIDLVERGAVTLAATRYLVLDEADQMLDLGFIHALRRITRLVGTPRQTLLFSATMPKQIEELSRAWLTEPARVAVSPPGRAADRVRQSVHFVAQDRKAELLRELLGQRPDDLSLVFARTKRGAEKLMKHLVGAGYSAASIHGNKSQPQRERAIRAFRDGDIRVLVATDVAARGIDIPGVSHVYNYDLPDVAESYVHRIGRTARAGAAGEAVALCSADERSSLRAIEKLIGISIDIAGATAGQREPDAAGKPATAGRSGRDGGVGHSRGRQEDKGQPTRGRQPRQGQGRNGQPTETRPDQGGRRHHAKPPHDRPPHDAPRIGRPAPSGGVRYGEAHPPTAEGVRGEHAGLPRWLTAPLTVLDQDRDTPSGNNRRNGRRRTRRRIAA
ncbi:MAG: RNA helicase [Alphaproteobacteria bacterium]|nr:MAG: RNA helicase [Alphaproteobacteria bacterium]